MSREKTFNQQQLVIGLMSLESSNEPANLSFFPLSRGYSKAVGDM